ncbi:MAG TPA: hypothetical protein VHY30_05130 [Verrucomicrobiae bacterium]|jgi:hypothetical protein|nr:hypothetical protein [Verrucomicrobiae bacterium]
MSTVAEIKNAIQKLDSKEVYKVGDWLDEFRERLFDEHIEADAKAGRLDKMIAKAKASYRAGKATSFP